MQLSVQIGFIIVAYLLGSLSGSIIFSKLLGKPDPRTIGSGNPGTANVLRTGQYGLAFAVFLFDLLKGMLPVWAAYRLGLPFFYVSATAIATCVGHIYPIFFQFRGGKGVATGLGAVAPIGWDLSGMMLLTWIISLLIGGYSSLASIISAVLAPLYIWWFRPEYTFPVAILSCLIIWRHHDNLQRLWRGEEPKLLKRSKKNHQ